MTRIHIMSDLHLEFAALAVPKTDADVVVLAGDIHVGAEAARWSGRLARRLGIPVVLIAGNHEHYNTFSRPGAAFGRTLAALHAEAARSAGKVLFLECESAILAGVRFIGCTLWTDFELYGDADKAMAYAQDAMSDFWTIASRAGSRFMPADARAEFAAARQFLEAELAKPFEGPTVVVTHHLPSLKSVAPRSKKDLLSAAFASDLDDLVVRSGAAVWIHGHTHDSCDYRLAMNTSDGSRCLSFVSPVDSEGYDALDRALRDSFPTSDAMSSPVVVGIGRPDKPDRSHAGPGGVGAP